MTTYNKITLLILYTIVIMYLTFRLVFPVGSDTGFKDGKLKGYYKNSQIKTIPELKNGLEI